MSLSPVSQKWDTETVVLSYLIAVTGSFCTIQIMEQWRVQEPGRHKRLLLVLASIALGGCGIWAMHFTGMQAQRVFADDGSEIDVNFELGMTIVSLIFPIVGVFVGLTVSSRDPFFLEIEISRRKAIVADQLKTMSVAELLKRGSVQRRIKVIALCSRLWRILIGGLWAALGVLGMHYMGMMAQRSQLTMAFDAKLVAASCGVAFVAATAAFWIIFRALTFWPRIDFLRIGSALVMGVAVCGTHYTGVIVDGDSAFRVASYGSLVLSFWLVSLSVVRVNTRGATQSKTNRSQGVTTSTGRTAVQANDIVHSRNAVSPVPDSLGDASDPPLKSTIVARLAKKQHVAGGAHLSVENSGGEHAWGVVPGTV